MSWVTSLLDEDTVYWPPPVRDGLGGYTWEPPTELKGRWQQKKADLGPNISYAADGSEIVARTVVWVDMNVLIGGYLWQGNISSLDNIYSADPSFSISSITTDVIQELAAQIVSVASVRSIPSKSIRLIKAFLT